MKGIVLAGGTGSRLWPVTWGVSKQLLPVYDKPLVHYPISTLMLAGIREILIITTPQDQGSFKRLLGDGSKYGITFTFAVQENPDGLAQAFLIGEKFIGAGPSELKEFRDPNGALIFAYKVKDPERYGVIEFNATGRVMSIEEKPPVPKSQYAVPGLYLYDNQVVDVAKSVKPSARGELEITAVNQEYLKAGRLQATVLKRGTAWLDTGTFDSLNSASAFIQIIEERQGQKVSCLEEVAWRNGWISDSELASRADEYKSSPFSTYLRNLLA
jgi:glucose-1-phosphate thymidylyltransferase